jgi:hypothetical protein
MEEGKEEGKQEMTEKINKKKKAAGRITAMIQPNWRSGAVNEKGNEIEHFSKMISDDTQPAQPPKPRGNVIEIEHQERTRLGHSSLLVRVSKTVVKVSCPISSRMWVIALLKRCRLVMSFSVSFRLI